ncbi:glutamate-5-semialdehyde dehydrogenase [Niastella yeongjuensis]|uniref:Gamma-glutamyl phosphate reductase n=1 Tax=Niastella yeongjuensis TaxID=354355 RepID=A0A1V9ENL8_9BACT|nr:glutamate-5-semialdehyde dehydrogenase [Niastella yeongjuensis]OQP47749.1 glutamate-5-semialdehyde dehydrogenase [Niastella yeongjuensis]SEP45532.1 glutamate-5-semialdehyde dehydrogenase [Niastella yeongjuensis]
MSSVQQQIIKTWKAAINLRQATDKQLKAVLLQLADELEKKSTTIIKANQLDVEKQDPNNPKVDRLLLNKERIAGIASAIRNISRLPNPAGKTLEKRKLDNGLLLHKIAVPLGVVGAIYESRPNVTYDIAALCIRSQNGCVLKGSSEAENSNLAAIRLIKKVLKANDIDPDCVTLLPSERETVQELFTATKYVDVLIPRGSESLIQFVRKNSLVPVIETGAGVCHVYVEKEASIKKAVDIVVNAKVSRPSVCNAMDTVLVDEAVAPSFLKQLQSKFSEHQVEIFADAKSHKLLKGYPHLQKAAPEDFDREFQSLKCAVKVVKNIDEALDHIREHSTKHSEAIVSNNKKNCARFLQEVDAAAVYTNASTRFTDGEEMGLGAEIGISTQKLHARGPFALEKLVTEKWLLQGNGQVR